MQPGDVELVETGECTDIYYIDTGMYDTNEYGSVYIIDAERPAIVDSGIGTHHDRILSGLSEVGISLEDLEVIALTHVHLDHAGGAGHIAKECPNATVYIHESGASHLIDPTRLVEGTKQAVQDQWQYYIDPEPVSEDRVKSLTDGDEIDLGTKTLVAHHAPGHAPHQVVFESPTDSAVFTADAAGIYVPRLDRVIQTSPPPRFDFEGVIEDVEMIEELSPSTLLYGHFGPAQTADRLSVYKDVITEWFNTVQDRRAEYETDEELVEALAAEQDEQLREVWTDHKAEAEMKMNTRGVCTYLDYINSS